MAALDASPPNPIGESPDAAAASFSQQRRLSPRRKSSTATNLPELVDEQLGHFGIDRATEFGATVARLAERLYEAQIDVETLWRVTLAGIQQLDRSERVAWFNAKKFLSFQLAKVLDTLQNPSRHTYQSLGYDASTTAAKGPYAVFDNVTAIFAANPVITRTATYIYACAEWIEDAFQGRELLLEIYSRLLNPTSVSLANHVVDLECGKYAADYFAWNFNSGMAAIDAILAHLLGHEDILITSRHLYGGAHQLIHDWYAKPGNLAVAVETFDGFAADDFLAVWTVAQTRYAARLAAGRQAYLYLESPCNPHGYLLDVPAICRAAHAAGLRVILDATVGTPFLVRPLQQADPVERPDFVVHSYTKDLSGGGSVIAGVVIGRNRDMFLPKGSSADGLSWDQTLFWNVYYVKGAFLNADAAFEVLQGMRTLELRMLAKCVNTLVLARFLAAHPQIEVHCGALDNSPNAEITRRLAFLGLPAPLFTTDMPTVPREAFQRFFDNLAPTFAHMISLGQSNTIVSCPALTTHSELGVQQLRDAGISPTTIRFAVGHEDPRQLLAHFVAAARLTIDPVVPDFSTQFLAPAAIARLVREVYVEVHERYIDAQLAEEI